MTAFERGADILRAPSLFRLPEGLVTGHLFRIDLGILGWQSHQPHQR